MNTASVIQQRGERLSQTFSHTQKDAEFPLLLDIPYVEVLFRGLEAAMNAYILASLHAFNPGKRYQPHLDLLEVYREDILALPNRTPNGKLEPKKEIAREFNEVEQKIEAIFDSLKIDDHVELMQLPVSVRIQDGKPRNDIESRHYSTSKMHSDIWTGEPAVCGAVIVPVLGDVAASGVEFYEPAFDSIKDFVRVFDDYLDAMKYAETAKRYDVLMRTGHVYVFDSYCLHKTLKIGGGMRASIDFRFTFKQKLDSDLYVESDRLKKYADLQRWHTAKSGMFIMPTDSVVDTLAKYGDNTVTKPKAETEFSLIPQGQGI